MRTIVNVTMVVAFATALAATLAGASTLAMWALVTVVVTGLIGLIVS